MSDGKHGDYSSHRSEPLSGRRRRRDRPHSRGASLRADRDRFLLYRQSRRALGADRFGLPPGRTFSRFAARKEAGGQARQAQCRLPTDEGRYSPYLYRRNRHQGEYERGVFCCAGDAERPSGGIGRPALPQRQSLASRYAGLPRAYRRLLRHNGAVGAQIGSALRLRAAPPFSVFRPALRGAAVQAEDDPLSLPDRSCRRRVRDCPTHRYQFPDAACSQ